MRFLSFASIFRLIKWSLGGRVDIGETNSSGFSSESLLPEQRERDATERTLCAVCSVLTLDLLLAPTLAKFELAPAWLARPHDLVIAAPGIAWIVRMWAPRRRPMDSTAIGVGCFTLSPWLVPYSLGLLLPIGAEGLLCATLGWQTLAVLATLGIGLTLDVSAEMDAKNRRD